jgi:metal-responsive CopG/Arc/MetJ family transcriptional regulator
MAKVRVSTSLPQEMVDEVDAIATNEVTNRHIVIRQAVAFFLSAKSTKAKKGRK